MYKYKLKEIEVGDTDIRKGVKTTVSDIDPETSAITYDVENVANFTSTYKALQQAREFLNTLEDIVNEFSVPREYTENLKIATNYANSILTKKNRCISKW